LEDWANFRDLLDKEYSWPAEYTFKFIIPFEKQLEVEELFKEYSLKLRGSKTGKFLSVTFSKMCLDSNDVIKIYEVAKKVEGLMVL